MYNIIYLVGLIVVVLAILSFVGLAYSLFPYLVVDRITYLDAATAPESLSSGSNASGPPGLRNCRRIVTGVSSADPGLNTKPSTPSS